MSAESNKALVRRLYEEVLVQRKPELVDQIVTPDYKYHFPDVPPNLPPGLAGFKKFATEFLSGLSAIEVRIGDQVAEGDKVTTQLSIHSRTAIGPVMTNPGTPQEAADASTVKGTSVDRFENGKIAETWARFDLSRLQEDVHTIPPAKETEY